jgi:hypothetical protein
VEVQSAKKPGLLYVNASVFYYLGLWLNFVPRNSAYGRRLVFYSISEPLYTVQCIEIFTPYSVVKLSERMDSCCTAE